MIWLNRGAFAMVCLTAVVGYIQPAWALVLLVLTLVSTLIAWWLSEDAEKQSKLLAQRVIGLGGSLDGLGRRMAKAHPNLQTAAAIFGQGELATMSYADLVKRLRADFLVPGEP